MRVFIRDQERDLHTHLEGLKKVPVMNYDINHLRATSSTVTIGSSTEPAKLLRSFLNDYDIFPPSIMISLSEWNVEQREMRVGDTIVQQVYLPPTPRSSLKVVFGVRIVEIIDEPQRKGFSYETLEGHVEKGKSTFVLEETIRGLEFKIHTHSTPGTLVAKFLGPVFSVPYQAYCTRRALQYVKGRIEREVGCAGTVIAP